MTWVVFVKGHKVDVSVLTHQPTVRISETVSLPSVLIVPSVPRETQVLTILIVHLVVTTDTC